MGEFREAVLTHGMFALTGLRGTYLNSTAGVTAARPVSDGPLIDFGGQLALALERKSGWTLSPKKASPGPWGKVKGGGGEQAFVSIAAANGQGKNAEVPKGRPESGKSREMTRAGQG